MQEEDEEEEEMEEEEEEAGHFSSVVFLCQVRWIEVLYTRTFACGTGSHAIPGFTARWTPTSWLPQARFTSSPAVLVVIMANMSTGH